MSTIKILRRRKKDWTFKNRIYLQIQKLKDDMIKAEEIYCSAIEQRYKIKETQGIYSLIDTKKRKYDVTEYMKKRIIGFEDDIIE